MKKDKFRELVSIMKTLRGKKGCPWDKKQTHKSILPYLIEEAYEYIEAVEKNDVHNMKEELGDLLLQVVFHAQMSDDKGDFDIDDVIEGINHKLIVRHPHVFGKMKGINKDWQVINFWEKHKKEVKKRDSVIDGVPSAMPALLRSRRLQSKAQSTGFKWRTDAGILAKADEELAEVKKALRLKSKKDIAGEIGDMMFVLVTLAYHHKIDPESALQRTNEKFIKRFKKVEKELKPGMSEAQMVALWKKAKGNHKTQITNPK
ncbi:MAG: nucleoside triphosphate pyrophosphohydrolase [Spirochaetia bacterium]|nr:nucleoside triphosphate pyrophosphohydrolase [Spirochaetia bacterium]